MTTAKPPAPYSTLESALASGSATNQLHHSVGHDRFSFRAGSVKARYKIQLLPSRLERTCLDPARKLRMKRTPLLLGRWLQGRRSQALALSMPIHGNP